MPGSAAARSPADLLAARAGEGYVALGDETACQSCAARLGTISLSVAVFCVTVSLVPIYNKQVFSGSGDLMKFPYPIATAFLQLSFVSLVLGVGDTLAYLACPWRAQWSRSWLFGEKFWYKLKYAGPAGLCFGLKFAVTNWGLQLVPAGVHLLLQATDLMWTVACARYIVGERVGLQEGLTILLSTMGTILVSFDATKALSAPMIPLLVNVLTPLPLALSVAMLRLGVKELMRSDNLLGGMLAVEVTVIKLATSSLTCLVAACALEGGHVGLSKHTGLKQSHKDPWWQALGEYPAQGVALMLLGAMFILIFQVNITWLTRLTSAVTVGIVGSVKVVPQWSLNSLFGLPQSMSLTFMAGVALVLLSSLLYLESRLSLFTQACRRLIGDGADCPKRASLSSLHAAVLSDAAIAAP